MLNIVQEEYLAVTQPSAYPVSIDDISGRTSELIFAYCKAAASLDLECFDYGTKQTDKDFKNIWSVFDANKNGYLEKDEFVALHSNLVLPGFDGTNDSMATAFFTRN